MKDRQGIKFTARQIKCLRFTQPLCIEPGVPSDDDEDWTRPFEFRRIAYSAGSTNGWSSHCFDASEGPGGDPEAFWPIRFFAIESSHILQWLKEFPFIQFKERKGCESGESIPPCEDNMKTTAAGVLSFSLFNTMQCNVLTNCTRYVKESLTSSLTFHRHMAVVTQVLRRITV